MITKLLKVADLIAWEKLVRKLNETFEVGVPGGTSTGSMSEEEATCGSHAKVKAE